MRLDDGVAHVRQVRDLLPIDEAIAARALGTALDGMPGDRPGGEQVPRIGAPPEGDRKSTRLNSSHSQISYAVFCLKKKKNNSRDPLPCPMHLDHYALRELVSSC